MSIDSMDDYAVNLADAYAQDAYQKGYEAGKRDAVKHGHWILNENEKNPRYQIKTCSLCGCRVNGTQFNFCPNCDAKMLGMEE